MSTPASNFRDQWLGAVLERIAVGGGWTRLDIDAAARAAGLSEGEQALAAPHGTVMLIDHFFDQAAQRTRAACADLDVSGLRTEPRMTKITLVWLEQLAPHHNAVRQALYYGARPWQSGPALRRLWSIADLIWDLTGDTSADYNHYTKRGLLSSVLPSIVLFWIESPTEIALERHVAAKIGQAAKLGKTAGSLIKPVMSGLGRQPRQN